MSRKIEVQIVGDAASLDRALGHSQAKVSNFGKATAAGARVGAVALGALGVAAVIGFHRLAEGQKVAAQTEAVLKSTGGAAHVSAKQIEDYGSAMLQKTGIDNEAIVSGENLLLTFRGIRNEAGKGNKIFDQARTATLNLSVAMHKDLNSSAILVGKALQDPIKGMTALRRVGVSLTDAQTKLVKHLVDTGHTMKAQKIILGELRKEFGGSAVAAGKTLGGQLDILKFQFENVAASLVKSLLPAAKILIGHLSDLAGWMNKNQNTTKDLVIAIAALSAGFIVLNAAVKTYKLVTEAATIAQGIFNAVMDANPIAIVIIAIAALGVALVIAYKKSETFRNIVNGAFNAVKSVAGAVVGFIRQHWLALVALIPGIGVVLAVVITHWQSFKSLVVGAIQIVKRVIGTVASVVRTMASDAAGPLNAVYRLFSRVASAVQTVIGWVRDLINWIGNISWPSPPGWLTGLAGAVTGGGGGTTGRVPGRPLNRPSIVTGGGGNRGSVNVQLMLDKRVLAQTMIDLDKDFRRQNAGSPLLSGR